MIDIKDKLEFARNLRRNPTFCEARLAKYLKMSKINYKFNPIICGFIPDFYFPQARLVVEVDGSVHDRPDVKENDKMKDVVFGKNGFIVRRYTNKKITSDIYSVIGEIRQILGNKANDGKKKKARINSKYDNIFTSKRFNPGKNRTLYIPVEHKKKIPIIVKRIVSRDDQ